MDIVEEIRQDREKGAKRLESEYKSGLMALALRFCDDSSDAEELVNATFATVVENIDGYLEQSAFFGWMCQILTSHHSRNVRRKANRMEIYPGVMPDVEDEKARDAIYDNLDAALLRKAIDELPKEQRDAIALHYFMDMSVVQIAKYLAVPSGTVLSRLHYARKALAAKLGAKVKNAAKKPGGKAVLLALALCGLAALGAGLAAAAIRQPAAGTRQPDPSGLAGPPGQTDPSDPPGETGPADSSSTGEQTMNTTKTTRAAVLLAAGTMALAADGGEYQYIVSGDTAAAAVSGSSSAASATGPLDVRHHSSAESGAMALSSIKGTGFFIIVR